MSNRIVGIDAFRLAAAFCVIALHVRYHGLGTNVEVIIRLLCRWAVPFFFIVTGYLLERKVANRFRAAEPLRRVVIIFIGASMLLLPLDFAAFGFRGTISYCVTGEFLLRGAHFHLWFLGSMGIGLLFVLFCDTLGWKKFLMAGSAASLLAVLVMGACDPAHGWGFYLARHASSIGFLYIGMILYKYAPNMRWSLCLLGLGVFLQGVEALLLYAFIGHDPVNHQMSIGTVLFAVGMFGVALNARGPAIAAISRYGESFSLGIYIMHPYCIWLCSGAFAVLDLSPIVQGVLLAPGAFIGTLLCLAAVRSYIRPLWLLMNGDVRMIPRGGLAVRRWWSPADQRC